MSEQRSMDSLLNWGQAAEPDRLRDIDDAPRGGGDGVVPFTTSSADPRVAPAGDTSDASVTGPAVPADSQATGAGDTELVSVAPAESDEPVDTEPGFVEPEAAEGDPDWDSSGSDVGADPSSDAAADGEEGQVAEYVEGSGDADMADLEGGLKDIDDPNTGGEGNGDQNGDGGDGSGDGGSGDGGQNGSDQGGSGGDGSDQNPGEVPGQDGSGDPSNPGGDKPGEDKPGDDKPGDDKPGEEKPGEGDGAGDIPTPDTPSIPGGGGGGPSGGGGGPSGGGGGPSGGGNGDPNKTDGKNDGKNDGKDDGKGNGKNDNADKHINKETIKNVASIVINEVAPALRQASEKAGGTRASLMVFGVAGIPLAHGHDRARMAAVEYLNGGVSLVGRWDTALQKSSLNWKDADDNSKYKGG
ncbi:hypothetical protein [Nonomuraea sp. bgisy101]|uniref:hypothetical protein n=1 Tax=Nonomuraea sp. bgisy101 TaxID=3413784 RepID=UPI003D747323